MNKFLSNLIDASMFETGVTIDVQKNVKNLTMEYFIGIARKQVF